MHFVDQPDAGRAIKQLASVSDLLHVPVTFFLGGAFMRIRFAEVAPGLGPSELVVGVQTVEGKQEEVVISRRQANDGGLEVGSAIIDEPNRCLVELPRESLSGRWRIWVPRSEVIDVPTVQAAE